MSTPFFIFFYLFLNGNKTLTFSFIQAKFRLRIPEKGALFLYPIQSVFPPAQIPLGYSTPSGRGSHSFSPKLCLNFACSKVS